MSSVVCQPVFMFGLRRNVRGGLCFSDRHELLFPAGSGCVCLNREARSHSFIPGSDKSHGVRALAISANRRYLAVSESGERPTVTVLELQQDQARKRRVLTAGDGPPQELVCLAFSPDSKYLAAQGGAPDWTLTLWLWDKHKILATVKTTNSSNPVTQVSFNPHNNLQLSVSGAGVFKLFRYFEGSLKQSSLAKAESFGFLCHTWTAEEKVIAGTDSGRLLVFESGQLRREISLTSRTPQGPSRRVEIKRFREAEEVPGLPPIRAILSSSRGFVCAVAPGTVCLFEKTEDESYLRTRTIQIPADPRCGELSPADAEEVENMSLSPSEDTLAVSTDRGQLYCVNLSPVDVDQVLGTLLDFGFPPSVELVAVETGPAAGG